MSFSSQQYYHFNKEHNYPLFLSSATATSKDLSQGTFKVDFNPVIFFPADTHPKVYLHKVGVWNQFQNVYDTTGGGHTKNNRIYFTDDIGTPEKYYIEINQGYHSLSTLQSEIASELLDAGFAEDLFTFTAEDYSNKCSIVIRDTGWQVFLKENYSPYLILGTVANKKFPPAALTTDDYYVEQCANIAAFNVVNLLNINIDFALSSVNGRQSNTIYSISPAEAPVGQEIVHYSQREYKIETDLAGRHLNFCNVWITDQNGSNVVLTEDFDVDVNVVF